SNLWAIARYELSVVCSKKRTTAKSQPDVNKVHSTLRYEKQIHQNTVVFVPADGNHFRAGRPSGRLVDARTHSLGANQPPPGRRHPRRETTGRPARRHARQRNPDGHGRHRLVLPDGRAVSLP